MTAGWLVFGLFLQAPIAVDDDWFGYLKTEDGGDEEEPETAGEIAVEDTATVTVAVNGEVPVQEMTRTEAKGVFSQQRRSWDGDVASLVVLPPSESESMEWLSEEVLGVRPAVFRRYLVERAYRMGYEPPLEAESDADAQYCPDKNSTQPHCRQRFST